MRNSVYGFGSNKNLGLIPININSTKQDFIQAYPHLIPVLQNFPNSTPIKNILKLHYGK